MPVSAKDFLEIAKWIHTPDLYEKEIGYRCSISRAYYAAFHAAKQHLQMDEYAEHEAVIERLKDFDNGYGDDELSGRLMNLKKKRRNADYRLSHNINRDIAEKSLNKSKKFIEDVVKLKI